MRPTTVGLGLRYRPSRLIGEDNLGTLWLGTDDMRSGAAVTVRLLDERLLTDASAVRRATAQLGWMRWDASNPHLARVLDYDLRPQRGPSFVVAEGFAESTLEQLLTRMGRMPVAWALRVTAAAADGLASAHARGIHHGALTSTSVFVNEEDAVKVTDMGLGEFLHGANAGGLAERMAADVLALAILFEATSELRRSPSAEEWEEIPVGTRDVLRWALEPSWWLRPDMAELASALASPDSRTSQVKARVVQVAPPARAARPEPPHRPLLPDLDAWSARTVGAKPATEAEDMPRRPLRKPEAKEHPAARRRRRRPALVAIGAVLVLVPLLAVAAVAMFRGADDGAVIQSGPSPSQPTPSVLPSIQPVTVPDVIGLRAENAVGRLERRGLVVASLTTVPGRAGVVVRSQPTQGEAVTAGTEVDLFVGNGAGR